MAGAVPCLLHRQNPAQASAHARLHPPAHRCAASCLTSTAFKSHSVRRNSGFLQVAVLKAPPRPLRSTAVFPGGASNTALGLLARASIRDVDDGHPNGINLRKRKSVLDICSSHPYLWCDSAKRRMKWLLASHPRGLLLADFPNNFRSVFRVSGCPPRGHCC